MTLYRARGRYQNGAQVLGTPSAFVGSVTDGTGVRVLKDGEVTRCMEIRSGEHELARLWALYPRDES